MAKQPKKRNKPYRPKHVQVPVMPEIQREFQFCMHGALAALRMAPSADAFDQLADIFNCINQALQDMHAESVVLVSGMRALQDVLVRAETTGCLEVRRFELPPIENAVLECEGLLPRLDIVRLHIARQKTFAAGRALRAAPNHPQEEEIAA